MEVLLNELNDLLTGLKIDRSQQATSSADQQLIKSAIDDSLLFRMADQVSKPPTTWFGLKIHSRKEVFQKAFGKNIDESWFEGSSAEYKYFEE